MNILDKIVQYKKDEMPSLKRQIPLSDLVKKAADTQSPRDFLKGFSNNGLRVIAEIKKASPSLGVIRSDFKPMEIAHAYEDNGAVALSVLTDEKFFQGALEFLTQVKAAVKIPCLRKDFTIHEYHIIQARAAGADAILLIAAILDDHQIRDYQDLAREYGMTALVEVHNKAELQRVLPLKPSLIGVNNRNLATFEVDIKTSLDLISLIPEETIAVSESGLKVQSDLVRLVDAGFDGFLIGETFMKADEPGEALRQLIS